MTLNVELDKLTPPKDITPEERNAAFEFIRRKIASHRHTAARYVEEERRVASEGDDEHSKGYDEQFVKELNKWANALLQNAWVACGEPGQECPIIDELSDTSTRGLAPLPSDEQMNKLVNTMTFLHITTTKQYSAHARALLSLLPGDTFPDERVIAETLKHPDAALRNAAEAAESTRAEKASANKTWRKIGIGASAVAGGALIGITGGLAAPLVGAGVTTVLAWLGAGGTAAGLLASGLAGSTAVCTALFGAYGARTSARMAGRHLKDVEDFAVLPVTRTTAGSTPDPSAVSETLAVRICVSGWLADQTDVTAPWTVFDTSKTDTYALQWEIAALQKLSSALGDLIKSHAMKYVKAEIIRRTVFASLMASLSPIVWLKIGKLIDNPWSNARALAIKTGVLLATLLKERAFGNRPVTLTGYSLGSLVILSALNELSRLPPSETAHLVEDVFLMGTPAPAGDLKMWTRVRRVVAGRLVNAYVSAEEDYVLAVLSRLSLSSLSSAAVFADWGVAGLQPVPVSGVENIKVEGVYGHVQWRGMVGRTLATCGARGLDMDEVHLQESFVVERLKEAEDGEMVDADEEKRLMNDESLEPK
ncbi:DUF726-domain-containing protein [Schizopora paradoxa]|uniref:DUF726-domain-containing protein n=1 Tax=Schizopora paradoxa TaxID=27342 RepID=A0A0H2S335_9AGAM|nr:DUF726-domain-containing protein [Schizopora paradoxa]